MADKQSLMLVNYQPGDECRIAVVRDGKLEEYNAEPTDHVSRVNNIYVGRVVNVEPAIQAAFVDFGIGESGFLHVSDLHPVYLGGGDSTERVGKKTPRRERPPIQECLKKGQEVTVQVLKEGVGTKGPTLTSYLSIPGRFLVMMPDMDRVGVSRKVDDDEIRRKMRDTLSQLELPEGFGFILRTAGLDRNKTELKRDLAYLQRLWKDMERRRARGKRPRLLYSESDLLVRTLRDMMTSDIDQVVIDHPSALRRAAKFMKIVAPRAQAKLMQYVGDQPLFHAYGIEQQILAMHAREVPLPSGGHLVIDETEALVAIDVNSGKSRGARDAETNAYRTNLEAADEICRQLRLRDLGGLVINDFIDMGDAKHRKQVEQRVRDALKRDRAKSTILPISGFGILEMTRQRMRGSHERVHFAECPTCRGRGLVQRPGSVAADALRELAAILVNQRVARVEMVVSPRVAGVLLSSGRRQLSNLEAETEKTVEVRLSDAIPADRVTFYAYDSSGSDIDVDRLPKPTGKPKLQTWTESVREEWAIDLNEEAEQAKAAKPPAAETGAGEEMPVPGEALDEEGEGEGEEGEGAGKKKRRRRRRRRSKKSDAAQPDEQDAGATESTREEKREPSASRPDAAERSDAEPAAASADSESPDSGSSPDDAEGAGKKKRRRRRRRRKSADGAQSEPDAGEGAVPEEGAGAQEHASDESSVESGEGAGEASREPGASEPEPGGPASKKKRSRKKRSKKPSPAESAADGAGESDAEAGEVKGATENGQAGGTPSEATGSTQGKKPRKKTTKRSKKPSSTDAADAGTDQAGDTDEQSKPKPKRTLYASRRKLSPSERARGGGDR